VGFLPPISSWTRASRCAATWAMPRPVSSEPVKEMARTWGWATRGLPTPVPEPLTKLRTPGGSPVAWRISTSRSEVRGAWEAGLKTTVLPHTRAGAIFQAGIAMGKFQGAMSAVTPTGWRSVYMKIRSRSEGTTSPRRRAPSPAKYSRMRTALVTSPFASPMVLPSSRLKRSETSSRRSSRRPAAFSRCRPRRGAGRAAQPGKARAAAPTASSTSPASES
jgi:hypothetical protein